MTEAKNLRNPARSPLADFGFFIEVDGCEATAQAIDFLLAKFPTRDRWCVEFGAGGDPHGSTTDRLIGGQNYSAVLIEGIARDCEVLRRHYAGRSQVTVFEKFVSFNPRSEDRLDGLLSRTPIPVDFDFLSVDIDGNDYHVWDAVKQYRPKLVMVEFNPTMPPELDFVQPADLSLNIGNSLAAIVRLAKSKGYELTAVLGVNAFFVCAEFFPLMGVADNAIMALWTKRDCVTHLFSGYDGRLHLAGAKRLPWQFGIPMDEARLQVLPRFLQKYAFKQNDKRIFETLKSPLWPIKRLLARLVGR
jgi:hypothetical protein